MFCNTPDIEDRLPMRIWLKEKKNEYHSRLVEIVNVGTTENPTFGAYLSLFLLSSICS